MVFGLKGWNGGGILENETRIVVVAKNCISTIDSYFQELVKFIFSQSTTAQETGPSSDLFFLGLILVIKNIR